MYVAVWFCVVTFLTVGLCQQQNISIPNVVYGIDALNEDVLNYTYPTSYLPYFEPIPGYEDCKLYGEYDFIIIGAGSSGTVLANRLTEIPEFDVLVLEGGEWENYITDIPGLADSLRATSYNWGYNVIPQKYAGGYINHQIQLPRGKAMGGSSVINAMIYARGNKEDYDKWAAMGNPSWSYENILKYFERSENASFNGSDDGYHGHNGTLHVEYSKIWDEIGQAWLDAASYFDIPIGDYNGKTQKSFGRLQMNELNGMRDSGARAFILPAINRSNLHISNPSFVLKVNIKDKTATGVTFIHNGTLYYAKAKKEVILSAGTIQTPQLMMLSGIGPQTHLNEKGINCIKDLPVGENLWDHLIYNSQAYTINHTYVNPSLPTQVQQYQQGEGLLTSPDTIQVVGYVSVNDGTNTVPDTEHVLHTQYVGSQPYAYYKSTHRYTEDTYYSVVEPQFNTSQWSMHSVLLHAKSRGWVRLKSANPFDQPLVDPRYFSNRNDIKTMRLAQRNVQKFAGTPALQKYDSKAIKVTHPLCKNYTWNSDEYWDCMVVNLAETVHHFGGTCKMGPIDNPTTVVDEYLQVHGIWNLRVADCSVIPVTTSGHTNAVAYMVGEKAADIIKEAHRFPCSSCDK